MKQDRTASPLLRPAAAWHGYCIEDFATNGGRNGGADQGRLAPHKDKGVPTPGGTDHMVKPTGGEDAFFVLRKRLFRRTTVTTSAVTAPAAGTGVDTPASAGAFVAGSDAPEMPQVKVGFMALTDCASIVMAHELGFDRQHGVTIIPTREASWARLRDKLVAGELAYAQALYGLPYGVHLGISGPRTDMAVLMTLNHNGQGLSIARRLAEKGATDLISLARLIRREPRGYTFAQTFPTGTHAMWLYYWLASAGIHPMADVRAIVVPPTQMVGFVRDGSVDGFSAGEPWNHRGLMDAVTVHGAASQDIWRDHPEKVLACTATQVRDCPNTTRAVMAAVLQASRWIDASAVNRLRMASTIAGSAYVNTSVDVISERIQGHYQDGMGRYWQDPHHLHFFNDGFVNFPCLSDGMWFMTQFRRWGLLKQHPDYLGVARQINQVALYRDVAGALGVATPDDDMRSDTLIDGTVWNGRDPARYADSFAIRAATEQSRGEALPA
jgi:nitrate/nitrite transport system substrate-binding protein